MKRCPQCNRVETDEALKFCRVDGATLHYDAGSTYTYKAIEMRRTARGWWKSSTLARMT